MASRAIVSGYVSGMQIGQADFDANGFFVINAWVLYSNSVDPTTMKKVLCVPVPLDPGAPAGWSAAIKAQLVAYGLSDNTGYFTDLTAATVYIPTYA